MWINRHSLNNSLVVFIHGLFGRRWGTWGPIPDIIQVESERNPLISSYDIYLFEYDTTILRQPHIYPFVVAKLSHFFDKVNSKYKTTVLIAHSQGGLIAKRYVLKMLRAGAGDRLTVDHIITIGTPHKGNFFCIPLHLVQHVPILGALVPFKQIGDLSVFGSNIRRLKRKWRDPYLSLEQCKPQAKQRHINSIAARGAYDWVVGVGASGFPFFDTPDYLVQPHRINRDLA